MSHNKAMTEQDLSQHERTLLYLQDECAHGKVSLSASDSYTAVEIGAYLLAEVRRLRAQYSTDIQATTRYVDALRARVQRALTEDQ